MTVLNLALLSLLLPAALARPQMGQWNHHSHSHPANMYSGPRTAGSQSDEIPSPSGIHGAPPLHAYGPPVSGPQYPAGNSSAGAATATGTGSSAGLPSTMYSTITVIPQPVNSQYPGSGNSQTAGAPESPASAGHGGNLPNGANSQCGGTVTITTANTVTVTVGAMGNRPSAPTSTPPLATDQNSPQSQAPVVSVQNSPPSSALPAGSQGVLSVVPPPSTSTAQSDSPVAQSQAPPQQQYSPAPQPQSSTSPGSGPGQSPPSSSSLPVTSSTPTSPDTVKPRGILYSSLPTANALTSMGWGCNWDSNPDTATGDDNGNGLNYPFVPQMWGMTDVHTSCWEKNSGDKSKYPYVMSFNEPNQPGQANLSPSDAQPGYISTVGWNKKTNGQKITSPCVSNDASSWLTQFFDGLKSSGQWDDYKPDCLCFHWYGPSLDELQKVIPIFKGIQKDYGIAEIWMSEWALKDASGSMGSFSASDLTPILSYLDSTAGLDRYSYYFEGLQQSNMMSTYTG